MFTALDSALKSIQRVGFPRAVISEDATAIHTVGFSICQLPEFCISYRDDQAVADAVLRDVMFRCIDRVASDLADKLGSTHHYTTRSGVVYAVKDARDTPAWSPMWTRLQHFVPSLRGLRVDVVSTAAPRGF